MMTSADDCYFYYYSTCSKGASCTFRHEPSALGTEEMCEEWEYGRCTKKQCNKRHMLIQQRRNETQCYWENQPSGCRKPHCMFKHLKPRNPIGVGTALSAVNDKVPSPKVDPVVVSMDDTDEESPQKVQRNILTTIKPKSVRLKLDQGKNNVQEKDCEELENEIVEKAKQSLSDVISSTIGIKVQEKSASPVQVKSLREIKREKILKARLEQEKKLLALKLSEKIQSVKGSVSKNGSAVVKTSSVTLKESQPLYKPRAAAERSDGEVSAITIPVSSDEVSVEGAKPTNKDLNEVKIKTFEEIMEEKRKRKLQEEPSSKEPVTQGKSVSAVGHRVSTVQTTAHKVSIVQPTAHKVSAIQPEELKVGVVQPKTCKAVVKPEKMFSPVIPLRKMRIKRKAPNSSTEQSEQKTIKLEDTGSDGGVSAEDGVKNTSTEKVVKSIAERKQTEQAAVDDSADTDDSALLDDSKILDETREESELLNEMMSHEDSKLLNESKLLDVSGHSLTSSSKVLVSDKPDMDGDDLLMNELDELLA